MGELQLGEMIWVAWWPPGEGGPTYRKAIISGIQRRKLEGREVAIQDQGYAGVGEGTMVRSRWDGPWVRAGSAQHDTQYTDIRTKEAYWASLYLVLQPRHDAKTLQGRYLGLVGRTHIIGTGVWARQLGEPSEGQVVSRRAPGAVTKLLW